MPISMVAQANSTFKPRPAAGDVPAAFVAPLGDAIIGNQRRRNTLGLSRAEVEHLAKLARLGLSEEDKVKFEEQLSVILDHFDVLNQIDTQSVPPTAHTLPLENVFSPDEPRPSLSPEEVLANAPGRDDDFFRVRAVLE
jgi:aspartyl-tRNA(Asn)/glutamyl-tRNA(Gln) amidotransferase subunit C